MVVITVDRYIAVCLPGEVQLRTVRRVKVAVAYITVLSVVCCLPLFFDWKTDSRLSPVTCDEKKLSVIIANPVPVEGSWWFVAHQIVCDCLIRTLIPFVMLLVLSSRMVVRLRRMTRQFRSPNNRRLQTQRAGNKTNWRKNMMATLVAVVGLFAVCGIVRDLDLTLVILSFKAADGFVHGSRRIVRRLWIVLPRREIVPHRHGTVPRRRRVVPRSRRIVCRRRAVVRRLPTAAAHRTGQHPTAPAVLRRPPQRRTGPASHQHRQRSARRQRHRKLLHLLSRRAQFPSRSGTAVLAASCQEHDGHHRETGRSFTGEESEDVESRRPHVSRSCCDQVTNGK